MWRSEGAARVGAVAARPGRVAARLRRIPARVRAVAARPGRIPARVHPRYLSFLKIQQIISLVSIFYVQNGR